MFFAMEVPPAVALAKFLAEFLTLNPNKSKRKIKMN